MAERSPRERYVRTLMSHVAEDTYPSATQMDAIEALIPREQVEAYVDVLLEKLAESRYPSIPMMRRVERLLERLPR